MTRVAAVVLVCGAALGCAQSPGPIAGRTAAIVDGTPSSRPQVAFVSDLRGGLCSGVVVGPQHVLTAKVCSWNVNPADVRVGLGDDTASAAQYPAVLVLHDGTPPRLLGTGRNELAVVITADRLPVAPAPLADAAPAVDDTLTIAGFGDDGSGAVGIKREGTATVDEVNGEWIGLVGGANGCSSDSGAPAFDGADRLVGVHHTPPALCNPSMRGLWLDVTSWRVWLDEQLAMGTLPDAGPGTDAGSPPSEGGVASTDAGTGTAGSDGGGCCHVGGGGAGPGGPAVASLLALWWVRRRMRRA